MVGISDLRVTWVLQLVKWAGPSLLVPSMCSTREAGHVYHQHMSTLIINMFRLCDSDTVNLSLLSHHVLVGVLCASKVEGDFHLISPAKNAVMHTLPWILHSKRYNGHIGDVVHSFYSMGSSITGSIINHLLTFEESLGSFHLD